MINITFQTKHHTKEFGDLKQGAFFTVLAEVEHPLYIETELFIINSATGLAVNAIELGTGKGYFMRPDIVVVDYNADVMASEVGE